MPAKIPDAPRLVIVGGGFGGLYAARALRKASIQITLVDKRNYHLFRPMTYQVATGLLSGDEVAAPLRSIFSKQKNVDVLMAEVTAVDTQRKVVHLQQQELAYDFLILATGIDYNYFGHEEWKRCAPGLDSIDDADRIRGKILSAFEAAENMAAAGQASPDAIQDLLTFVIVGAGTAGVEMAGTMLSWLALHWPATSGTSTLEARGSYSSRQRPVFWEPIPSVCPRKHINTWKNSVSPSGRRVQLTMWTPKELLSMANAFKAPQFCGVPVSLPPPPLSGLALRKTNLAR